MCFPVVVNLVKTSPADTHTVCLVLSMGSSKSNQMASMLADYFLGQLDNAKRDVVPTLVVRMMALARVNLVLDSPACCRHE